MAPKIRWSPRAVEDLESIGNYISRDSPLYATLFIQNILTIIRHIPDFPTSGRIVPEFNMKELREKIYGNYRIV